MAIDYQATIKGCTSVPDGFVFMLDVAGADVPYACYLNHEDEVAQEVAQVKLGRLVLGAGLTVVSDTDELIGKTVVARISGNDIHGIVLPTDEPLADEPPAPPSDSIKVEFEERMDALRFAMNGDNLGTNVELLTPAIHQLLHTLTERIVQDMLRGKTTRGDLIGWEHASALVLAVRMVDLLPSEVFEDGQQILDEIMQTGQDDPGADVGLSKDDYEAIYGWGGQG